MKEYQDATTVPLSAQYFYNQRTNLFDQDPTNDEGMFPRDALKLLRTQGMCLQNTYPYGSTHSIPAHAHEEARWRGYRDWRKRNRQGYQIVYSDRTTVHRRG